MLGDIDLSLPVSALLLLLSGYLKLLLGVRDILWADKLIFMMMVHLYHQLFTNNETK